MIPWISDRLKTDPHGRLFEGSNPLCKLVLLLQEIEGPPKQELMLVDPPRSVVWYGDQGEGMYLFRKGRHVSFASFALRGQTIAAVGFRYNDPMDPGSGCRKEFRLLSGWQGFADLTAAAMRRSKAWKNLETIETEVGASYGEEFSVYEVWATSRQDRTVGWEATSTREGRTEILLHPGKVTFARNQAQLLARVRVLRQAAEDVLVEDVAEVELYPEFASAVRGEWEYDSDLVDWTRRYFHWNDRWTRLREGEHVPPSVLQVPVYLDLSEHSLTRYRPHDELRLNVTWK